MNYSETSDHKVSFIAVVGGGPKGTYGFERLAAWFNVSPPNQKVEIHVFNKSAYFGAGDIYHPDQPPYLLINNPVGDTSMWIDEGPAPVVDEPLSLTAWLQEKKECEISANEYVSRAMVGQYLGAGFEAIAANLPSNVQGEYMVGEVTDIHLTSGRYKIKLKLPQGASQVMPQLYDHILLATGHPPYQPNLSSNPYHAFARDNEQAQFVPFIYPVKPNLSSIPVGLCVGIKGLGLTFIDAVLALTEGRGGTFSRRAADGELVYRASGREPRSIFPFSRSGLPMVPRDTAPCHEQPLKFFTVSALNIIQENKSTDKLHFKNEIWPLLKQEMQFAFYRVKMRQTGFNVKLSDCENFAEVRFYIDKFHEQYPGITPFHPNQLFNPIENLPIRGRAISEQVQAMLKFFITEAKKGEQKSPWAAAAAVWRKATPAFVKFYNFGGLTPASQQYFDAKMRPRLNRITFGPPIENIEKIVALMEAGILNFEMAKNPRLLTNEKKGTFMLASTSRRQLIDVMIDARIPKVGFSGKSSLLYKNLLDRGLINLFKNETDQHSYQPGCIAISKEGYALNSRGEANKKIAVTGTPTEGITFDNDTLSRMRNNFVSSWAHSVSKKYSRQNA